VAQAQKSQPDLDRAFQSAAAHYKAKEYAEAEKDLEPLLARFPNSFEVNELMGLVYAAQGLDQKANRYLKTATRLKPNDAASRPPSPASGRGLLPTDISRSKPKCRNSSARLWVCLAMLACEDGNGYRHSSPVLGYTAAMDQFPLRIARGSVYMGTWLGGCGRSLALPSSWSLPQGS
jgi:tetratricopeptide (TPR) repeat protein